MLALKNEEKKSILLLATVYKHYDKTLYYENTPIHIYLQPENGKFSDKNSDILHIPAQNIECGPRRF